MFPDAEEVLQTIAEAARRRVIGSALAHAEPKAHGYLLGYDVELAAQPDAGGQEPETVRIYIDTTDGDAPDERPSSDGQWTVTLRNPETGEYITAWPYPYDPDLPALAATAYPDAAGVLATRFGIDATGDLEMLAYRPGKRAVLRLGSTSGDWFLKVVRPKAVETLHLTHQRFQDAAVPVPQTRGWSDAGLVVLSRLPGVPASNRIRDVAIFATFVDQLRGLTAAIAEVDLGRRARTSLLAHIEWYRQRLSELLPAHSGRIDALARSARTGYDGAQQGTLVTIHGDLHLGQVFVDPDQPATITGILDIDTAGSGDRADDLGCLHAHLLTSAATSEAGGDIDSGKAYRGVADAVHARWAEFAPADPGVFDRATAIATVHLLAHAFGTAVRGFETGGDVASMLVDEAESMVARHRTAGTMRRAG